MPRGLSRFCLGLLFAHDPCGPERGGDGGGENVVEQPASGGKASDHAGRRGPRGSQPQDGVPGDQPGPHRLHGDRGPGTACRRVARLPTEPRRHQPAAVGPQDGHRRPAARGRRQPLLVGRAPSRGGPGQGAGHPAVRRQQRRGPGAGAGGAGGLRVTPGGRAHRRLLGPGSEHLHDRAALVGTAHRVPRPTRGDSPC